MPTDILCLSALAVDIFRPTFYLIIAGQFLAITSPRKMALQHNPLVVLLLCEMGFSASERRKPFVVYRKHENS